MDVEDVGVVIGRFQVASLTDGHEELISEVEERHPQLVVMIGCHPVPGTADNPLSYQARAEMVRASFPGAVILPLLDRPSDEDWSDDLDRILRSLFPTSSILLYGGRDSFMSSYSGTIGKRCLSEYGSDHSGTSHRAMVAREPVTSEPSRRGIIYSATNRYPISHQVVDIAVIDEARDRKLILGMRHSERGMVRFPGGFVGVEDRSLEGAAARELREELNIDVAPDDLEYVGSTKIDDWRYRGTRDGIKSALFLCVIDSEKDVQSINGGDDLDAFNAIAIKDLSEANLVMEHLPLLGLLKLFMRD